MGIYIKTNVFFFTFLIIKIFVMALKLKKMFA